MGKRMVFMGAGAVGGYVGGHLARSGADVTLIDPWPEHIEYIKHNGIHLSGTQGDHTVPVKALHLHEVQGLFKQPVDIAFICTKSYDTEWATMMIRQYLAPDGFVVSLQNSINEDRIAGIVGWGKVVGCIASTIGVDAYQGRTRHAHPAAGRRGVHGLPRGRSARAHHTPRPGTGADAERRRQRQGDDQPVGRALEQAHAELHGQRHLGLHGHEQQGHGRLETSRRVSIRLAGEAIRVGQALGYDLESIRGLPPEKWVAAADGEPGRIGRR